MFQWSEEQQMIRTAVRQFVEAEVAPLREELEHGDLPPYGVLRKLFATFGMDAMARESVGGRLEGLVLGSASWLPPPDDGRLVLAYRAGDEEGSCRREVTVDARSGGVSVTESLDC